MADTEYSLGLVVERIARGKAASSTLIFVIEDDPQNGADHMDAHRSPAFVVGPYVRHGLVSTRYTTLNVLRTIEALLDLKPLGLNDALASPMADLFDPARSNWSYRVETADILRTTKLSITAHRFIPRKTDGGNLCARRSTSYWAAAPKGQNFRTED